MSSGVASSVVRAPVKGLFQLWSRVRLIGFFLLAPAVILLSSCAGVEPVVKIGLVAPFEGRHRSLGYDAVYAARLAIREVNAVGGVGGVRVALVALDDGGNPELARQAAASLVVDPDVVAVVGHGLPGVTDAARPLYGQGLLPLLPLGQAPFSPVDPGSLPDTFLDAYAVVTPFDEVAGSYAGPTYDALWLLLEALELAKMEGAITRESVAAALDGLQYDGVTGRVYRP
ncbi:MAG: ABC transporter substrate-binding protein [Candidatus Promineifilaceae bacterium]|nr:ABC transporter substrate-binding protein [Candidatus Promineifilaceae bacterium]